MGAGLELEWPISAALEDGAGVGVIVAGLESVQPLKDNTMIVIHNMANSPKRLKDNHRMTFMR